jgi:hypothetical protein
MSGRAAGQHDDGQDAGVAFFLQELVIGITTGALYALMALSFTMFTGGLKLLNFVQTPAAGASLSKYGTSLDPLAWSLRTIKVPSLVSPVT